MAKLVTFCKDGKVNIDEPCSYNVYSMNLAQEGEKTAVHMFSMKDEVDGPSFSTIVSWNGSTFVIGGIDSSNNPKTDVLVFNCNPVYVKQAPPLHSGKFSPIVVPTDSSLFVFSTILHAVGSSSSLLEKTPRCEFLDARVSRWTPFPMPSNLPPPPTTTTKSSFNYHIDAYASTDSDSNSSGVYLSIKDLCSYYVCFYASTWTLSPKQLPFYDEAKMLGSGGRYVGLCRNACQRGCLGVFKLEGDTRDGNVFCFNQLSFFSLVSIRNQPYRNNFSDDWLFHPLSHDTICLINCREASSHSHFIVVQALRLSWGSSVDGDGGNGSSEKKMERMELLWHFRYPDMPLHDNWCLIY